MSKHVWAPELHYLDGGWYIYFAAGMQEDIWAIRPYVLHCMGQNPMEDKPVALAEYVRNILPSCFNTAGPSATQKPTLSQS